jgi:hypothetical protein
MKKQQFIVSGSIVMLVLVFACSGKKEGAENQEAGHGDHHATAGEEWKEMDDFHMIMAESFHPYKDSSNLDPAKQNADALVASAEKWANAPLPEKFKDDEEIKFKLEQLKTDASSFSALAKSGDDKAIGESLTKLHDLFHTIMESWYGGGGGHEH